MHARSCLGLAAQCNVESESAHAGALLWQMEQNPQGLGSEGQSIRFFVGETIGLATAVELLCGLCAQPTCAQQLQITCCPAFIVDETTYGEGECVERGSARTALNDI